jgi:ribonuclease P protein component
VIGRIVRSADFERVLDTPSRARSAHFAVHHLADAPSRPAPPRSKVAAGELSTGQAPNQPMSVDESTAEAPALSGCWLGAVVPKRHARRAATRNLIKRQIRRAAAAEPALPAGLWVVRLRSPFHKTEFISAASDVLSAAAADELAKLLADAARRSAA